MKEPPIHVWLEPIDATHVAIISLCEYVAYGGYHRATFFLIADGVPGNWSARWRYEERGEEHFREQLLKQHHGYIPYVGRAADR